MAVAGLEVHAAVLWQHPTKVSACSCAAKACLVCMVAKPAAAQQQGTVLAKQTSLL